MEVALKIWLRKTIWDLLFQCLSGLLYLHGTKKIIHRDIKPDNLLLDLDGNLKISDFGISAIKSDEAEEFVKCHNSSVGPRLFMAPEVESGDTYDFKSDIYMLGLTFFYIMSHKLPKKYVNFGLFQMEVNYKNVKLPNIYSEELQNFIMKLMSKDPKERPDTKNAFIIATTIYAMRYFKITSILSTLYCFASLNNFKDYFKSKSFVDKYNADEKKFLVTKCFTSILDNIVQNNNNCDLLENQCIKLRLILYTNQDRISSSPEIKPLKFIGDILAMLHRELNKNKGEYKHEDFDETNEKEVIQHLIKKFKYFSSKISDIFYFTAKFVYQCPECNNPMKYYCNIYYSIELYPQRASVYVEKKDIDIIDLFKHYMKKRLFVDRNIFCKTCNKTQKNVYEMKKMYTPPVNLILKIDCSGSQSFNLTINKDLNIAFAVERNDCCKTQYTLAGAIFANDNRTQYFSYFKNDLGWNYYNGKNIVNSSFEDLSQHKNPSILFYTGTK